MVSLLIHKPILDIQTIVSAALQAMPTNLNSYINNNNNNNK
jgi:hypothetical protein